MSIQLTVTVSDLNGDGYWKFNCRDLGILYVQGSLYSKNVEAPRLSISPCATSGGEGQDRQVREANIDLAALNEYRTETGLITRGFSLRVLRIKNCFLILRTHKSCRPHPVSR